MLSPLAEIADQSVRCSTRGKVFPGPRFDSLKDLPFSPRAHYTALRPRSLTGIPASDASVSLSLSPLSVAGLTAHASLSLDSNYFRRALASREPRKQRRSSSRHFRRRREDEFDTFPPSYRNRQYIAQWQASNSVSPVCLSASNLLLLFYLLWLARTTSSYTLCYVSGCVGADIRELAFFFVFA